MAFDLKLIRQSCSRDDNFLRSTLHVRGVKDSFWKKWLRDLSASCMQKYNSHSGPLCCFKSLIFELFASPRVCFGEVAEKLAKSFRMLERKIEHLIRCEAVSAYLPHWYMPVGATRSWPSSTLMLWKGFETSKHSIIILICEKRNSGV